MLFRSLQGMADDFWSECRDPRYAKSAPVAYVRADRLEAQEALLKEVMAVLERCPPTSNPTLTAEYNLERIEAWWRLEVRPVLAKLRQHLEGSHRAEK